MEKPAWLPGGPSWAHPGAFRPSDLRQLTLLVSALMILAQVAYRGWALYPSWFFADDYVVLHDATTREFSVDLMLTDFNSNLMPGARVLAEWVAASGELNWTLAATIVLVMQLVASISCLVMLATLFGTRPAILVPLALYLSSAVTIPALMWWVAAVNQVPYQAMFFLVVTAAVQHLRTRRISWLLLTLLGLGAALFFYTKALLLGPVLAYVALAYFATGNIRSRTRTVLSRYTPAAVASVLLLGGYALYYRASVPQPFEAGDSATLGEVLQTFLGTSAPTSLVGGPWSWWETTPPVVLASPPSWSVLVSWLFLSGLAAYSMLRRRGAGTGWMLLIGYALALALLLAQSRGQIYGKLSALEYRYLTDIVCAAVLCLGLVFFRLRDAAASSAPHADPPLRLAVPRWVTACCVALVVTGGIVSTTRYVHFWHHQNAGKAYVKNLQRSITASPGADLPLQRLPDDVMPDYTSPVNWSGDFVELFRTPVDFPSTSAQLQVIDGKGTLRDAVVDASAQGLPGPRDNCGWVVRHRDEGGREIPLTAPVDDGAWWARLGYLSSGEGDVIVSGADDVAAAVEPGINSLFVKLQGPFDAVTVTSLSPGVTLCVDALEVGVPIPVSDLP